jgi:hypothetical protein
MSEVGRMSSNDPNTLRVLCRTLRTQLAKGKVIPFLGAGVNRCDRDSDNWLAEGFLPDGGELATHLAREYLGDESGATDLLRVAQHVSLATGGDADLRETLHALFDGDHRANRVHLLLAQIPARLRESNPVAPCPLIVTTNYDDVLERAFAAADEELDVVYYEAKQDEAGSYVHLRPEGERARIEGHTDYRFDLPRRTVLLKLHGAFDRGDETRDSYVITEDDYIDYLAHESALRLIPAQLMACMQTSHFLFLGYGMRDWNLRVILRYAWSQQGPHRRGSWAIQKTPDPIDQRFWQRHNVEIHDVLLEEWVEAMQVKLG